MAYSFTPVVTRLAAETWMVSITELDVGVADEATVDLALFGAPSGGMVTRQQGYILAGPATTLNPILESDDAVAHRIVVCENEAAIATPDNSGFASFHSVSNKLYHRSRPDVGGGNILTFYFFTVHGASYPGSWS